VAGSGKTVNEKNLQQTARYLDRGTLGNLSSENKNVKKGSRRNGDCAGHQGESQEMANEVKGRDRESWNI